ncbi:peptidylprolyl isomerase [Trichlorobacter ammonificans]|uniref:Periplasmic chaperone PpiD n=1 Tax=Trichlorobacter ammonificans TaxID=2916410 RepID=A0ABM9D6Q5_9BACT|nr:peptidylprolyl isomerase [Trichlorobacter ammonificans]CAH2030065.1 Peptidyl-prolyl cis-trans isomerase ppiD [Trichlorobacter ammonificans]
MYYYPFQIYGEKEFFPMLDLMRKKKETFLIKAIFIVIVLSFIGTIFLVWGKGEEGFSRSSGYAAKVDRTVISYESYQNSYQRLRDIYQQVFGPGLTPEVEKELNLRQQAIDRLIDNVLIQKAAKGLGVTVSKDEVAAAIAVMPAFQQNGAFDYALYQQTLRTNRITANDFEESQKRDLLISKARTAVMNKTTISDDELLKQYHRENDKIELSYVSFSAAELAAGVKPTDADLEDHLKKNAERFKTPEKIALTWLLLPHATRTEGIALADDEVESFYRKNLDRYLGKDNNAIPLEQIRDRVKTDALRQKAAKQLYEKAADTLFQNIKSGDIALVASKLGARTEQTALFTAAAPPAALAGEATLIKKAFELKQGELGGPVETAKGVYIFKVSEKKAAELPPLAQVRGTVEQQVRLAKAEELARQKAAEAQKALASGDGGLKLSSTPAFGYNGQGTIPGIGSSKPMLEKVFDLTTAVPAPTEPFLVGNRWYAARLKQRIAAPADGFASRKEEIKARLLPVRQETALRDWLKELRAKAKIEINPALTSATP